MHPLTERYPDLLDDTTDPALLRLVADLDRLCAPEPLSPRQVVASARTSQEVPPMHTSLSLNPIPIEVGYVQGARRTPRRTPWRSGGWAALILAAALPILAVLALVVVQRGRLQSTVPQQGTHTHAPQERIALAPLPANLASARPGTWAVMGAMHQARGFHTATLLPNGLVLVAGGCRAPCDTTVNFATAELYHPDTGTWTRTGSMHDARQQFTMTVLLDGRVLATGGCRTADCSTVLAGAELYDPRTGRWTRTGSLHGPRALQAATLLPDGRVLVAGGISSGCNAACSPFIARVELYDPRTGRWTVTGSLRQARARPTATLLPGGRVLVAGGSTDAAHNDSGTPIASAELYDPRTGTWTITRPMHQPRSAHAATLLPNGTVLVAGGYNDPNGAVLPAELYHPRTATWTVTGSMHHTYDYETGEAPTLLPNGQVLAAGNATNPFGNALTSAELYNPHTGRWTATGSLHQAHAYQTTTLLANGQVLVAGGSRTGDGSTPIAEAELYQP